MFTYEEYHVTLSVTGVVLIHNANDVCANITINSCYVRKTLTLPLYLPLIPPVEPSSTTTSWSFVYRQINII